MIECILKTTNLSKTYSGIKVLDGINFELLKGEVHAIVGENGAGKSTFIKLLSGVEEPDHGSEIYINGSTFKRLTPKQSLESGVTVMYQDISLFPNLSVAENICLGNTDKKIVDWKNIYDTANKVLSEVGCNNINPYTELGNLSIGEQQMVALARIIMSDSQIVIMDEPSAALSMKEIGILYDIIEIMKCKGKTIIYISHKLEEIYHVADRITVFRDGKKVITKSADEIEEDELISLMVGRELIKRNYWGTEEKGDKLFEVINLNKTGVFSNISFDLFEGEILCFTGLVGSKRSELFQTIFGISRAESGSVKLKEKELKMKSVQDSIDNGIYYIPEDRRKEGLFFNHNLVKNITAAIIKKYIGKFRLIDGHKEEVSAENFIEKLNIKPQNMEILLEKFSGGNQQKVLISKGLDTSPRILIVDEPTMGVDVYSKNEIYKLLRELADNGVGIIVISSDLQEAISLSDRIIVMKDGKIVQTLKSSDAIQEEIIRKELLG